MRLIVAVSACVPALAVAGCGAGGGASAPPPLVTEAAPPVVAAAPGEGVGEPAVLPPEAEPAAPPPAPEVTEAPAASGESGSTPAASEPEAPRVPAFGSVFVIVMENTRYGAVIGSDAMPYVNELAGRFALAANYRTTHSPSLPNYLVMVAGRDFGVANDGGPGQNGQDAPHLGDQLDAAGIDWRAYMEGMARPCQTRIGTTYAVKHNPFIYFRNFREDAERCAEHNVPYDLFAADLAAGPRRFTWITPDMNSNGHDTNPATADRWLSENIPPILASPAWQDDGVLFLAWDEGSRGDDHIALVVASPLVRPGVVSETPYDHRSLLATIEDGLGLPRLETTADVAPMIDLFR